MTSSTDEAGGDETGIKNDSRLSRRLAWVDSVVKRDERSTDASTDQRNRLLVLAAFGATGILLIKAAFSAMGGLSSGWVLLDLMNAVMWPPVVLLGLRFGASSRGIVNLIAVLCLAQITLFYFGSGGQNMGALFALVVVPMITMLLSGWRTAIWFSLAAIGIAVLALWAPTTSVDPSNTLVNRELKETLLRDVILLIVGMSMLAALLEWLHQDTLKKVETARGESQESESKTRELLQHQSIMLAAAERLQLADLEELDTRASEILQLVASLVGAEYASLTLFDRDLQELRARYHWCEPKVGRLHTEWQAFAETYRWSSRLLRENSYLAVDDTENFPPEAQPERDLMQERKVKSWFSASVRAGDWANGILSIQCHGQKHQWLEEEISSIRLMAGILAGVVGRHQAGVAVRQQDIVFSRVFEAHPEGLAIVRIEDGRVLECNEGFLRVADLSSRKEAESLSIQQLDWMSESTENESLWKRVASTGRLSNAEIEIESESGETRHLIISSTSVDVENVSCVLLIFRDMTVQRELELQFRQSQKMEAVGLLAGGIAHDFNNMLTVIGGFSEVLRDAVDDELREDVESIRDAAKRSSSLTRQLLAFSRRQVLRPEMVDLGELVAAQKPLLVPLIGEDIEIQLDLDEGVSLVRADRGQVEQVIMNLVTNARDAMPDGGELIFSIREIAIDSETGLSLQLSPGKYARVSVADNGCGMPERVLARVFEPFFTTKEKESGSGLGLSTAHGIIEQSGGAISVNSEEGSGTIVDFYLPIATDSLQTASQTRIEEEALGRSETILLVEDEDEVRRLAKIALETAGYQILTATNGREAILEASEYSGSIDLLLTDVVMPLMGGVDLAENIRKTRPRIKVAMMSGYPGGNVIEGSKRNEEYEIISKPFRPSELRSAIARIIDN